MTMFSKQYCRKHGRDYYSYMCPECAEELLKKESKIDKVRLPELENTKPNKIELYICPNCHERSLFYNENADEYECVNIKCRIKTKTIDAIKTQEESAVRKESARVTDDGGAMKAKEELDPRVVEKVAKRRKVARKTRGKPEKLARDESDLVSVEVETKKAEKEKKKESDILKVVLMVFILFIIILFVLNI